MAVLGSVAFDCLEREGHQRYSLGGTVVYSGLTAALMGWEVELLARVPEAEWPRLQRLEPYARGHWLTSASRTTFHNREFPDGERQQRMPSAAPALEAEALRACLDTAGLPALDWIHLGPLHPLDLSHGLPAEARKRCSLLSADLQGWVRWISEGAVLPGPSPEIMHILPQLDWAKAAEGEWAVLQGELGCTAAEAVQRFGWKGLLISHGLRGGELWLPEGRLGWNAAPAAPPWMETGAGDVFAAAFLACMAGAGGPKLDAQAALEEAARIAALHVSGSWLPVSLQLDRW
jgi:hypothetical protein